MKLLGVQLGEHDSNLSYFDGKDVHYAKIERIYKIKHLSYKHPLDWKHDIKKLWGVSFKDIDQIGIVLDPWVYNLPEDKKSIYPYKDYPFIYDLPKDQSSLFPHVNYPFIDKSLPIIRIQHHYAHALSCWPTQPQESDVDIVIDGCGEINIGWTVFKNHQIIDQGFINKNGSLGQEISKAGHFLGIQGNSPDVSGKLMGLQSYGNIDYIFLSKLDGYSMLNIDKLFNFELWINHKQDLSKAKHTSLDWIKTIHYKVGQILINFFSKYATSSQFITYSGGVAQNVVWNSFLKSKFPNLIIPPHCGDEGLSLGVIEYLRKINKLPKFNLKSYPYINSKIK